MENSIEEICSDCFRGDNFFVATCEKKSGHTGRHSSGNAQNKFQWGEIPESEILEGLEALLLSIGEDPNREGLLKTPKRFLKAFVEMTEGYKTNPADVLSTFFDAEGYDEMVILKDIDFKSLCEHHLLPFSGTAAIGYIPDKRIIGLSKLARLVECFSKRLQVQERMTVQIANSLSGVLAPKGVGVIIRAHHSCMSCRGVKKSNSTMVTSSLLGKMREDHSVRAEFLSLCEK